MRIEPLIRWIRHPNRMDLGLLLLLSLVVTILWFPGQSFVLAGDYAGVPFHPWVVAGQYLSSWNFWTDTGSALPQVISNQVPPIDLVFYLGGSALGLGPAAIEFAYTVLLAYFLGACGTYFLTRTLFQGRASSPRLAALIAGSFYILNPIYAYASGAQSILGSAIPRSALPLALFLFVAGLRKQDIRYAFGLGLVSLLLTAVFARAMEVTYFLVIAAALGLPYLPRFRRYKTQTRHATQFLGASAVTAMLVNAFWIVPFVSNYGLLMGQLSSFPTSFVAFESQFTTPANVLRLQGYWTLYVDGYVPYASFYQQPIMIAITFVLPILVVLPLGWRRGWSPETLTLALLLALFLALSLGTNLPLGVYEGLVSGLPFFKLFKDPWVFLEPLSLVYALLLGLSFDYIARFLGDRSGRPALAKVASIGLALALLGTISAPVLTGAAAINWYSPAQRGVNVPTDYQELDAWLNEQGCDCATLLLPGLSGAYVATTWGYQGATTLYRNLLPGRLITGSGSSLYGLQGAQSRQVTQYVYDLLSTGDPFYTPTPIDGSQNLSRWATSVESGVDFDTLAATSLRTPWNDTVLAWGIRPSPGGSFTGHGLSFSLDSATKFSGQVWLEFWIASSFAAARLDVGIGDQAGQTGWYSLASHILAQNATWSLVALPITMPDGGLYNASQASEVTLETTAPTDGSVGPVANATVLVGAFRLSAGVVSQRLVSLILRSLNVGFVVLDASVNESFYPALDPNPYQIRLAQLPNLAPVHQIGNLTVYLNDDPGSLVSIPSAWIDVSNLYEVSSAVRNNPASTIPEGFIATPDGSNRTVIANATLLRVQSSGPTDFTLKVEAHGYFLLTLATGYAPDWYATVGGSPAGEHVVADGFANGWLLNLTGTVAIEIHFAGQVPFNAAIVVSSTTMIISILLALFGPRKIRRIQREVVQKIRIWVR